MGWPGLAAPRYRGRDLSCCGWRQGRFCGSFRLRRARPTGRTGGTRQCLVAPTHDRPRHRLRGFLIVVGRVNLTRAGWGRRWGPGVAGFVLLVVAGVLALRSWRDADRRSGWCDFRALTPPAASGRRSDRDVSSPSHGRRHRPDTLARERTHELAASWDGAPGVARQPAWPRLGGRPGRRRGAGRRAQEAVDQEGVEALGARPGDPDDGSDHARGEGHAGQGPGAVRQGHAARSVRSDHPERRRDLHLPGADRRREGGPRGLGVKVAQRRDRLPVGPDVPRHQARRDARRRSRPAPTRSTWSSTAAPSCRATTRPSSTRSSRSRRRAATPHLKVILETGELETLRQRAPREHPGHGRGRRLHQDLDRQGRRRRPRCR